MINIIAAVAENGAIGYRGRIPWDIPEDKARFKALTWGHVLVMGRRTYEDIGFPLPGRQTIVVSSAIKEEGNRIRVVPSLAEALREAAGCPAPADAARKNSVPGDSPQRCPAPGDAARRNFVPEIFICGGEQLYREALPAAGRLYITEVHRTVPGDAFFPGIPDGFAEIRREDREGYSFTEFIRTSMILSSTRW